MERLFEITDHIIIRSKPEIVFETITKADLLSKWWPQSAISNPKKGGSLIFYWPNGTKIETAFDLFIHGKCVSFQFGPEYVSIHLTERDNSVLVNVAHSKIKTIQNLDSIVHIAQSWTFLLFNLKVFIELGLDFRKDH